MGSNANNHAFGADKQIGKVVVWRFSISRSRPPAHRFSPPMSREKALAGARALAQGDVEGARAAWGGDVAGWLDSVGEGARGALLEAAREMVR